MRSFVIVHKTTKLMAAFKTQNCNFGRVSGYADSENLNTPIKPEE